MVLWTRVLNVLAAPSRSVHCREDDADRCQARRAPGRSSPLRPAGQPHSRTIIPGRFPHALTAPWSHQRIVRVGPRETVIASPTRREVTPACLLAHRKGFRARDHGRLSGGRVHTRIVCLPATTGHRPGTAYGYCRLRLGALNGGRLVFACRRRPCSIRPAVGWLPCRTNGASSAAAVTHSPCVAFAGYAALTGPRRR